MDRRWLSGILLMCCSSLFGSLDQKTGDFFNKFNTVYNTSDPVAINSQLGVHFVGGNGVLRTNVYDINPIHVGMPTFSAGCGGIDYNLGAISMASGSEIKNALKGIASNAVGYAFLLGVETISPSVSSTIKQIQTWANQLNSININSCELASSMVQGIWPKTQRGSAYICEHAGTSSPLFKDLIEAKHGCRDDSAKRTNALNRVKGNNSDILIGNYNIAWKAMESASLDEETKNLFMNITGTIVVHEMPEGGIGYQSVQVFPPQYKKALELLRYGGEMANAYQINENKIDVKIEIMTISPENAWKSKVHKILTSIQSKIIKEGKEQSTLTDEERTLLLNTRFPIGSLASLMAQTKGGGIALDHYSDSIAFERVLIFAEEVVRDTINRAEALRAAQVTGYELDEYIKQVHGVLKDLQSLNLENLHRISVEHDAIKFLMDTDKFTRDKERGV
ncbi:MAG: conjugal transfer protein TraH [Chlamydiales bacterium]|nr:conjugal transfer protein TraH [Chlamydiales bacterium]MBY0529908.1 conjugal transfer protein TraH [Rhabdochlamydiaceae bacterium]